MSSSAFTCLSKIHLKILSLILIYFIKIGHGWLPNTSTKLVNNANKLSSISFRGNTSQVDHFTVLYQDESTILLGGRNQVYNLSLYDFTQRTDNTIYWPSSEAYNQLCILKGKTEDDCQNYIRILVPTAPGKYLVCGTNSYKPMCRIIQEKNGQMIVEKEMGGVGWCPYNPDHNSTSIYSNGYLFSATVADFSGLDPLIYKEPLSTELSDLSQLNAPNFVSSLIYGDYIYFFFRETAIEYMNCGKAIYSRVARVCKHDKGGLHVPRWTTFLKARLNCSVPGEYPFYFDEIQSTSDIVEGNYGSESNTKIIYSAMTTPDNAIAGSAVCIFGMGDVQNVFKGPFKHQEGFNRNWLPLPESSVPTPRPGECVQDSRVLADKYVTFVKTHPLMEKAVPPLFGQPLLIRVSLNYRFTAITVDSQVRTVNHEIDEKYDVIYVGTDEGKVLKVVNIPSAHSPPEAVVISENEVFSKIPVKQLKIAPGYGKVIAISNNEVKLVTLNHCEHISRCSECLELRDPHCAWDSLKGACVSVDAVTSFRYLIQDIKNGSAIKCRATSLDNVNPTKEYDTNSININSLNESKEPNDPLLIEGESTDCNEVDGDKATGCASQSKLTFYTSEYLHIIVAVACVAGLCVGFLCGYLVSRRFHVHSQYPNPPFIEQHNHLDSISPKENKYSSFHSIPEYVSLSLNIQYQSETTYEPEMKQCESSKE